jgi:hypothetical protein
LRPPPPPPLSQFTAKDMDLLLERMRQIVAFLKKDIAQKDNEYGDLAVKIEKSVGRGRMSEGDLLKMASAAGAPADAKIASVQLAMLVGSLKKKRAMVLRKEDLIAKMDALYRVEMQQPVLLRTAHTTAYYNALVSKRGAVSAKDALDKEIFGIKNEPVAAYGGGGGGGGVKRAAVSDDEDAVEVVRPAPASAAAAAAASAVGRTSPPAGKRPVGRPKKEAEGAGRFA